MNQKLSAMSCAFGDSGFTGLKPPFEASAGAAWSSSAASAPARTGSGRTGAAIL